MKQPKGIRLPQHTIGRVTNLGNGSFSDGLNKILERWEKEEIKRERDHLSRFTPFEHRSRYKDAELIHTTQEDQEQGHPPLILTYQEKGILDDKKGLMCWRLELWDFIVDGSFIPDEDN